MKNFTEQFEKKAASIKLKASERKQMREQISSYMEYHPLPAHLKPAKGKSVTRRAEPVIMGEVRTVVVAWR